MDLTTVDKVKELKGWTAQDGDEAALRDEVVGRLITGVSAQIQNGLGRHTQSIERTERFSVGMRDGQTFQLRGYPVDTGQTVTVKSDYSRAFTGAGLAASDYFIDSDLGLLEIDGTVLDYGKGALQVTYTGGMAADTAAFMAAFPDIAEAAAMQSAFLYEGRKKLGQQSRTDKAGTVTLDNPQRWLDIVKMAVQQHKLVLIGG